MTDDASFDLAIIGGGPAGQAAAEQAARAGLSVVMIDEQARMGGQILRQPPLSFRVANWLPGSVYAQLKSQLARVEAMAGIAWRGRTSVVGLFRDGEAGFRLILSGPDGGDQQVAAQRVLIAAGCYDLPVALPGWTLPGVMSAGGVQAFVKSQQLVPGERFVLAGTHPLQLLVAAQLLHANAAIAAVLFAQSPGAMLRRILRTPFVALRHAPALVDAAAAFLRLTMAGVPIRFGRTVRAIEGADHVTGVQIAAVTNGSVAPANETLACDGVALCFGFIPQADLPRAAGAETIWIESTGGWATKADPWMRSSCPDLYVAGETTGVGGAQIALAKGTIAGLAIASDAGRISADCAVHAAAASKRRLLRLHQFAAMLDDIAAPAALLPQLPDADTLLCRCEGVRLGAIVAALDAAAAPMNASAAKLVTRAGMGLCQGRGCEHTVLRLIAARSGRANGGPGFTPRFPVRPVMIADLIE